MNRVRTNYYLDMRIENFIIQNKYILKFFRLLDHISN
jgi:hypothetical protein